ncbi:MAG TPA: methyltransferase domain-containing protein [Candidatus Dormibacteraeota bacterium]
MVDLAGASPNRELLDLATGTGAAARWLVERGARVVGVDIAPGMIELARLGRCRTPEASVERRRPFLFRQPRRGRLAGCGPGAAADRVGRVLNDEGANRAPGGPVRATPRDALSGRLARLR